MSEQIFTMRLSSCGNPDWGQRTSISPDKVVTGSTLSEMRKAAEDYSEEYNLGSGNWMNPVVRQGAKVIGYFSYNGRLWEGPRPGPISKVRKEILIDAAPTGGAK